MRLVFASDTHTQHEHLVVPEGDVFIHCGDFTMDGNLRDVQSFGAWVRTLPHAHKLVIAGNHDFSFEREPQTARGRLGDGHDGLTYLQDSGITIGGLRFWGSPWQPWFYDWAFNLRRGPEIAAKWELIPERTDVLVTHGPPHAVLDLVQGDHVGCADLSRRVELLRPRVHAFGHIHEGSGTLQRDGTMFVNAAICDHAYVPTNPLRCVDVEP
jgi:predicted phosphodiesterase